MFYKFKTGVIYIGGAWCKNCQAVISLINKTAKKNKINPVYPILCQQGALALSSQEKDF